MGTNNHQPAKELLFVAAHLRVSGLEMRASILPQSKSSARRPLCIKVTMDVHMQRVGGLCPHVFLLERRHLLAGTAMGMWRLQAHESL